MKKLLLVINLLEDFFFVTSLLILGSVLADIIVPDKIAFFGNILSMGCHQRLERCFVILGHSVALCARCLGIYLGFTVFHKIINQAKHWSYVYYLSLVYIC